MFDGGHIAFIWFSLWIFEATSKFSWFLHRGTRRSEMNSNSDQTTERTEIGLELAARVLVIPYTVITQRSRRQKLGLVDAVRPTYCSDFRRRFVTLESVRQVQQNRALMRNESITQK